ncbi:MAG TPA: nuclear transport factor 2 family protein [Burkholderiales bacterium]|nr:nuclear transport factor 2 family protein [Burkholderiales bacterium]
MSQEKEILALEDVRFKAMVSADVKLLGDLMHDDLIYTHSSAVVDGKASYLEAIRSGKTRYKSQKRFEERVRLCGDCALVTGRAEMEAEVNGVQKTLRLRYLDAWTKTPQGWKFIAWQSTSLPQ